MVFLLRSILRFGFAAFFLATALGKALNISSFALILREHHIFLGIMIKPIVFFLIAVELGLAVWLFTGETLHEAAWFSLILNLFYALFNSVALLRGFHLANSGLFGVYWAHPLTWVTIGTYLALGFGCFYLYRLSRAP